MSDKDDWDFGGADDAKMTIRAAIHYLLKGATGGARGDIVQEIISIVRQVASGPPPGQPDASAALSARRSAADCCAWIAPFLDGVAGRERNR